MRYVSFCLLLFHSLQYDVGSQRHKANDEEFIESQVFQLLPNTTLLLCSDGLTDMITSSTITTILAGKKKLEGKADSLIDAALNAGGKDNVTVVLVEFQSNEPEPVPAKEEPIKPKPAKTVVEQPAKPVPSDKTPSGKNRLVAIICLVIGLIVGGVVAFVAMNHRMNRHEEEKAEVSQIEEQPQEQSQDQDTTTTDVPEL